MGNKIKTTFRDKITKKLHKKGDTYKHENVERVAFLVEKGFLEEVKAETPKKKDKKSVKKSGD